MKIKDENSIHKHDQITIKKFDDSFNEGILHPLVQLNEN